MKTGKHMCWVRPLSAILLFVSSVYSAHAVEVGLGLNVGTLGPGIALTMGLSDRFNVRLSHGQYSTDDNIIKSGVNYDVNLDLKGTSLLLDWHPFSGGFRFSGGIVRNANEVTGVAVLTGPIDIGDTTYTPAQVGGLNAAVNFDDNAGYLGIGWGNAVASGKGLTFAADLGVLFTGSPNVNLNQVGGTLTIPESDIAAEERNLESELDEFEYYPIVRIGIAYHF